MLAFTFFDDRGLLNAISCGTWAAAQGLQLASFEFGLRDDNRLTTSDHLSCTKSSTESPFILWLLLWCLNKDTGF